MSELTIRLRLFRPVFWFKAEMGAAAGLAYESYVHSDGREATIIASSHRQVPFLKDDGETSKARICCIWRGMTKSWMPRDPAGEAETAMDDRRAQLD
jgi:hypothetical protein